MEPESINWWRPRIVTLVTYALTCAALCETDTCYAEQQANNETGQENCRTIDCWFVFYRWMTGLLRDREWAIVFWTAIIAAIALGQFVMFYLQWKAIRAGAIDTRDAAVAAKISAEVAKDSLRLSQRAYVSADLWSINTFEVGKPVSGSYKLGNSGRLAANLSEQLVSGFIGLTVDVVPNYDNGAHVAHSVIRPLAHITSPFNFIDDLTQEQFDKLVSRDFAIFVWGRIKYTDTFGDPYETGYAAKLVWQKINKDGANEWVPWFMGMSGYHYNT
jgi:hypothetical protein